VIIKSLIDTIMAAQLQPDFVQLSHHLVAASVEIARIPQLQPITLPQIQGLITASENRVIAQLQNMQQQLQRDLQNVNRRSVSILALKTFCLSFYL
jgi:hypothetical protein